jgi:hypothetical protein
VSSSTAVAAAVARIRRWFTGVFLSEADGCGPVKAKWGR